MSTAGGEGEEKRKTQTRQRQNELPSELLDIIVPALKVGGITGVLGAFVGSFAGVIRSSTPRLFALASGIQWFTLGTAIWGSRGVILHAWGKGTVTPKEKISASALAGGLGGMAGGILRSRKNVIPGAIMFSIFGAIGQTVHNTADAKNSDAARLAPKSNQRSWLDAKWSPVKVLTDEEYEKILREKLLRVNAQIALVEENIEALRKAPVAKEMLASKSK